MKSRNLKRSALAACWSLALLTAARAGGRELTQELVNRSIDNGVSFLLSKQDRRTGTWPVHTGNQGGVTALCTLALVNSGLPANHRGVQQALEYLRSIGLPDKTYAVALQTMAFCAAEPERDLLLIRRNVAWLEHTQLKGEITNGAWGYSEARGNRDPRGDKSNTQFALLALFEAQLAGVPVKETTWRRAEQFWKSEQHGDGSWHYRAFRVSSGSMTSAGIASLVITSGMLSSGDARVDGAEVECCGSQESDESIEKGLNWLARNFSVRKNPGFPDNMSKAYVFYYLYALERVGRLTGHRMIGNHDWYREGAAFLVDRQESVTGAWEGFMNEETRQDIATAYALLFLSKGRRPVLVGKIRRMPDSDWNYHRHDVANLTRYVESRWKQALTWQTIDIHAAGVEDLLQAPVLFLSGRDGLRLSSADQNKLREYIENGGFIFAEACCDGKGFDRDFREIMGEIFPDNPLEPLAADHPIWYAEQPVASDGMFPLWGINACCRTSVVYCPENISCYWELAGRRRNRNIPGAILRRIDGAKAVGANVMTYATNRQMRGKLDVPTVYQPRVASDSLTRATLRIAKLRHGGGSDDAPAAHINLLRLLEQHGGMRVDLQRYHWLITEPTLPDCQLVFMHGRRSFQLSEAERRALRQYLTNGGVLMADSICAANEFTRSFRREMQLVLPHAKLTRIPSSSEVFTANYGGYDLSQVTLREPRKRLRPGESLQASLRKGTPDLESIELEGRQVVFFSPFDISCALENHASLQCKGYVTQDAAKIAINIALYALQQ